MGLISDLLGGLFKCLCGGSGGEPEYQGAPQQQQRPPAQPAYVPQPQVQQPGPVYPPQPHRPQHAEKPHRPAEEHKKHKKKHGYESDGGGAHTAHTPGPASPPSSPPSRPWSPGRPVRYLFSSFSSRTWLNRPLPTQRSTFCPLTPIHVPSGLPLPLPLWGCTRTCRLRGCVLLPCPPDPVPIATLHLRLYRTRTR